VLQTGSLILLLLLLLLLTAESLRGDAEIAQPTMRNCVLLRRRCADWLPSEFFTY